MRLFQACVVVAAFSLAGIASASTMRSQSFSGSARLGTTRAVLTTNVLTLSTTPGSERFRVRGLLRITSAGMAPYAVDPWDAIADVDAHGMIEGLTDIGIVNVKLARLSGNASHADVIVYAVACGASCTWSSTFFTYDAARRTYAAAPWAHTPDWDTVAYGEIVHLDASHDAIATTVPSPFDDCGYCLPGTVPVLYAIRAGHVTDISAEYPLRLLRDAAEAKRGFGPVALFRYLADECRAGRCARAWRDVEARLPGDSDKDTLSQMRDGICSRGYAGSFFCS